MSPLKKEIQIQRSLFLKSIRLFLDANGFLEIDTPIYKSIVGMEPYLTPFEVRSPNGKESGFLITSPEYSLKSVLASGLEKIYEITHTFRSGEGGSPIHTAEFLMLELYAREWKEQDLRVFLKKLLSQVWSTFQELTRNPLKQELAENHPIIERTMESLFLEFTGRGYTLEALKKTCKEKKIEPESLSSESMRYEDYFFLVFLNLIEPLLPKGILFCYDFPAEMAALAETEGKVAKRFEIYWDGIEIANAFQELADFTEQKRRFQEEQELRRYLGKTVFPLDMHFLGFLERGEFPPSSGVSLGLDRIFMKFLGEHGLGEVSPYAFPKT